jgi:hypothetical protein
MSGATAFSGDPRRADQRDNPPRTRARPRPRKGVFLPTAMSDRGPILEIGHSDGAIEHPNCRGRARGRGR